MNFNSFKFKSKFDTHNCGPGMNDYTCSAMSPTIMIAQYIHDTVLNIHDGSILFIRHILRIGWCGVWGRRMVRGGMY